MQQVIRSQNGVTLTEIRLMQGSPQTMAFVSYVVRDGSSPKEKAFTDLSEATKFFEELVAK